VETPVIEVFDTWVQGKVTFDTEYTQEFLRYDMPPTPTIEVANGGSRAHEITRLRQTGD
jgi:hypothetical protein